MPDTEIEDEWDSSHRRQIDRWDGLDEPQATVSQREMAGSIECCHFTIDDETPRHPPDALTVDIWHVRVKVSSNSWLWCSVTHLFYSLQSGHERNVVVAIMRSCRRQQLHST